MQQSPTITVRKAADRGQMDHGWLQTAHTFSFGSYHDPAHMGFRALRVINEDYVAAAQGFGTHPHQDMEIVTYVLAGELEHKDSMGNGSKILPGEVQRMTAGTGVTHSELNPSPDQQVHLLQIWILPEARGLEPSYEQKEFPVEERKGTLRLVASRDGREGSVTVHQDVSLYASVLERDSTVAAEVAEGRHAWIQVARGSVRIGDVELEAGDGAAVSDPGRLEITGTADEAELLLFDLN